MKSLCLTLNKLIGEAEWCCSHFIIIVMIVVRAIRFSIMSKFRLSVTSLYRFFKS